MSDSLVPALIEELAKKTSVCWLGYDGGQHAAWHVWLPAVPDGPAAALVVVSGGAEQPLPGIEETESVRVTMRSKENGGRLVTWVGAASTVGRDDPDWDRATAALVGGRLNLPDLATAADTWARHSTVTRITPTGEVLEEPGSLPDGDHRAEPRPTPATTRGPLPRVLHRRVRRRPRLS